MPIFYSRNDIVLILALKFMIHFQSTFVYGVIKWFTLLFCMWKSSYSKIVFQKHYTFTIECYLYLKSTINVRVCFWDLNFIPLIFVSILIPVPHNVDNLQLCSAEIIKCESESYIILPFQDFCLFWAPRILYKFKNQHVNF